MSYERKVKIHLHGYLKDLAPDGLELSGTNVAEIINGFCRQTKAFDVPMGEEKHCIQVVGFNTKESLFLPIANDVTELHLAPELSYGKGGLFKVLLGALFIGASLLVPLSSGFAYSMFGTLSWFSTSGALMTIGKLLLLGGLLEMLSPSPKTDSGGGKGPDASRYLGANQNTVRIGTRIPIGFGRHKIAGHYISFDVDAVDVAV